MEEKHLLAEMKKMNFDKIKKEVAEASDEVPFGNSIFQNTQIIKSKELTRGRQIRALLLNVTSKVKILDELKISLEMHSLNRRKKEKELDDISTSILFSDEESRQIEYRLVELEIEKMDLSISSIRKQLRDTIIEVESTYSEFKKLGTITREEFEKEEEEHFKLSIVKNSLTEYAQRLVDIGCANDAYLSLNNKDSFLSKDSVDNIFFSGVGVDAKERGVLTDE